MAVATLVKDLILKFPNWSLKNDSEITFSFLLISKLSDNDNELLEILRELKEVFNDKNYIIEITNSITYQIKIKEVQSPKKYRKMYTSGCFDIFHYGHLNILKQSKEICDYLIVGVSTDELIKKEKGRLPVIPFHERINVVKAIKYVDEVIPQVDKNKQKIVDDYQIDAISVGDDWRGKFPATSCPVEYFTYTKNVSSTILKDILKLDTKP
ncbi:MAG: adenylyltransferase/cytidyltransferase family protein [Bacteroidota bacterium]